MLWTFRQKISFGLSSIHPDPTCTCTPTDSSRARHAPWFYTVENITTIARTVSSSYRKITITV
jgi:hypothetical protein